MGWCVNSESFCKMITLRCTNLNVRNYLKILILSSFNPKFKLNNCLLHTQTRALRINVSAKEDVYLIFKFKSLLKQKFTLMKTILHVFKLRLLLHACCKQQLIYSQNYSVFDCCHRSKENRLIPNNFLSGPKKNTSI